MAGTNYMQYTARTTMEFTVNGQWKRMNQEFAEFYEEQLQDVTTNIDMQELGVIDFVFNENKVNIEEEILSSLKSKWNNINKNHNNDMEQEAKGSIEQEFQCDSMDNCLICDRIRFIMELFYKLIERSTETVLKYCS